MSMRQKMAGLLAAFMLASAIFPSHAAQDVVPDSVSGKTAESPGTLESLRTAENPGTTENSGTAESSGTTKSPGITEGSGTAESSGTAENQKKTAGLSANGITEGWQPTGNLGQIDVTVGAAVILRKAVTFNVILTDTRTNAGVGEGKITLNTSDGSEKRLRFEGLAPGSYTLTVKAPGFADYSQEIFVDQKAYTVVLMTGFLGGMTYEEDVPHPGVLKIGDVNGDGKADRTDRDRLVDAIDKRNGGSGSGDSDGSRNAGSDGSGNMDPDNGGNADLNGDGVVDLTDLECFAMGQKEAEDTQASPEISVPAAAIHVSEAKGTKVESQGALTGEGTLAGEAALLSLMKRESGVVLSPDNGGAISENNSVSLNFDLTGDRVSQMDGILIRTGQEHLVRQAVCDVTYIDEDGKDRTETINMERNVNYLLRSSQVRTELDDRGNIRIFLGAQVAVKKVTFTITGMQDAVNLAEISSVEFVNDMENRIPEPSLDIPEGLEAVAGNKNFRLSWEPCVNVTGYEVRISQEDSQEKESQPPETVLVARNNLAVVSFNGDKLKNNTAYTVQVQSVNGTWRSGYGSPITVTPKADKKPEKPDNVKAVGKYRSIAVSWKKMGDTDYYNLYYKKSQDADYQKIGEITGNSYLLSGLEDHGEYVFYVTGVNELGESGPSLSVKASTTDITPASMPKYNLINVAQEGRAGAHIENAWYYHGRMEDSPLDTGTGTAWGTVDHSPTSYYNLESWDSGGYNPVGEKNGLFYEFDQAYKLDTIALQEIVPQDVAYGYAQVRYWDEAGTAGFFDRSQVKVLKKLDGSGRIYYQLKLSQPVMVKKIQIGLSRYLASGTVTVSEVYFYRYDTLMEEIMALYADDLHTILKEGVTQETIDALRAKINEPDPVSGEAHPDRELLLRELENAENILKSANLSDSVLVYNSISTRDVGRGFGGLNAWQPLGVTAAAGEEIVVYVGHNTKKTGENTNLQLVATQYHAEAGAMFGQAAALKVGVNRVTIPQIVSTDTEKGGALYVQYTGSNANDRYAVRISGGVEVPRLDLYQVTDAGERLARTKAYVDRLEAYVGQMEEAHNRLHRDLGNAAVKYEYQERNCILGASDIMLDTMMFSLPAKQILLGAGNGSPEEKAQRILDSMDAMEGMMHLFYQHKGLNANAEAEVDRLPGRHLNIRYQRMFAGAFMYASGNHIGIEWPESAGMMGGVPVVADSEGRYQSGRYFGWGIAHEIGHCINQGSYAVAEVTNNYFAQLAKSRDQNATMRFTYPNVYQKVTSGTKGAASNVFTQLGMYWQLHLAYDKGYNFKTYENVEEQLANLFYARVDTYSRTPSKAPGQVALALGGNTDQNLMRLSCAAAEKDILEFFERWGKTPDEGTRAYAAQFPKETRAIYYASDDARVYALKGGTSRLGTAGDVEAVGDEAKAQINANAANQVDLAFGAPKIPAEDVLGYEVVRCTISGGKTVREPVGFATENTFSDSVYTMNNRTLFYEVTLIDRYLNRSAVKTLNTVKIQHDGSQDKTYWTIHAEDVTAEETKGEGTEDMPCAPPAESTVKKVIDQDIGTSCSLTLGEQAVLSLEFHQSLMVTGLKYTLAEGGSLNNCGYEIRILAGEDWRTVAEGSFGSGETDTIYFANADDRSLATYMTSEMQLLLKNQNGRTVELAELDVLGVTGDNVDFRYAADGRVMIGYLAEDYRYGSHETNVIPKDSVIFTGSFKGNPAYNVVVLYDQDGKIVGGKDETGRLKAHQIILADIPKEGKLQDVSDGTWIYWMEPGQQAELGDLKKVRAELYRVNNAQTNEGQRMVSDSVYVDMPDKLSYMTFNKEDR